MNNKGITIIGILIVGAVVTAITAIILSRTGIISSNDILTNLGLGSVVPVPEKESVEDLGRKTTGVFSGGWDFDKDTPGYKNFQELNSGGVPRDGIPSIDEPGFESMQGAKDWMRDSDVLFVLQHKGVVRGYPQKILNRHEIVNDVVSGDPLAVTFCPLCGSSLAFDRRVGGQILEFGVSGLLHNNDLVMYDRQTESLWQQITGEAIVGELFGERLSQTPLSGMRWNQFKDEFEEAEVLSRPNPLANYNTNPYGDYESNPNPLFPMDEVDDTIHPKTFVYGVEVGDSFKAYQEDDIRQEDVINDTLEGREIRIAHNAGDVRVIDVESGDELPATRLFWFAWKAFRPETELYQ